ncbi:MAG: hypothetical protein ACREXT_03385 [Gammaproteobacteria bacterium]
MTDLVCWRCGALITDEPEPFARTAACRSCRADLHVCKLCEFYATGIANDCREPIAERVVNQERANFCGYFKPRPRAFIARGAPQSREALDALFGGTTSPTSPDSPATKGLDDLFRKPE